MPKVPGYAGNVLYVDLTKKKFSKEPLDPELVNNFLGGYGINLKLAHELISPAVDPIASENKIIIGAGPFVGTHIPGGAKVHITTKYPINGAFSRASGGGAFGLMLKSSGYDHVVISGKEKDPVYLKILNEQVEICNAFVFQRKWIIYMSAGYVNIGVQRS